MNLQQIIKYIKTNYNIDFVLNHDPYGIDQLNSGWYCDNTIYLSKYDDEDIIICATFHELGHYLSNKLILSSYISHLSRESIAWEIGFSKAKELGFDWDYNSKQYKYARTCLKSHIKSEYNELNDERFLNV